MQIITETVIEKPAAAVWDIVGNRFGQAYEWASLLNHSTGHGAPLSGQVCEARTCDVKGMGNIKERLVEFDPERHVLRYEVTKGFPFFVRRGVNHWQISGLGATRCRVTTTASLTTKGIVGFMMAPMMRMQMSRMLRSMLEDLKHYAETGQPHPRKLKSVRAAKIATARA
jgi:uncharacterized membrane protein